MQCSSCGFENMPGSDTCGRCASSLRLATAVMDVHPPRAGHFAKRMRRALPLRRVYYSVRDGLPSLRPDCATDAARSIFSNLLPWPLLWRLVIPGWSHFYAGQKIRGRLFLWGFLALFIPGMLL